MKLTIIRKDGRWLVNGKRLQDLSRAEKEFMNGFFKALKIEVEEDEELTRNYINRQASDQNARIKYNQLQKELA